MVFICQICHKDYPDLSHLSKHINNHEIPKKEYYDKYLKKDGEGICPECGGPTLYKNKWQNAYKKYCSEECKKKGVIKNIEKTTLNKYGVSNVNKLKSIRNKIKKTNKKIYGNSCPMQNSNIQKTIRENNLKNLGVELPFQSKRIQKKGAKTRKKKYGAKYTYQSQELYNKCKNTMIQKYEAPFTLQSPKLFEKSFKTRILLKKFNNSDLFYQGSYELDFLEKYYTLLNIQRAPFIKYRFKNKQRIYYPDFYILEKNLIIEIKNRYLAKRDKELIKAKRKAVLSAGFQFIIIVNKNYEEFEKLISSSSL
jgi:very-short-patch-repair endonuclease